MEKEEILHQANEIVGEHGLVAELLEGVLSVGVGGDERTYLPVLCLRGSFPGDASRDFYQAHERVTYQQGDIRACSCVPVTAESRVSGSYRTAASPFLFLRTTYYPLQTTD